MYVDTISNLDRPSPCAGAHRIVGNDSGVELVQPAPVVDEGKVEGEVVGDGDGPLDGALVGADHNAVLPLRDVLLDPLAEEGLHLKWNCNMFT